MLSLGMDSALALAIARRRRELAAGSGRPCLAARVMSRDSLENSFERSPSWRSLRNWIFLNFEWPAILSIEVWLGWAVLAPPASGRQFASRSPKGAPMSDEIDHH